MLGPSQIVLECNTKVPMLVELLQPSRVERDVDGVLGLEGQDDGFRGVDELMPIPQPSSCCVHGTLDRGMQLINPSCNASR